MLSVLAGAAQAIVKLADTHDIIDAVRRARAGKHYWTTPTPASLTAAAQADEPRSPADPRQAETLSLVIAGHPIANRIGTTTAAGLGPRRSGHAHRASHDILSPGRQEEDPDGTVGSLRRRALDRLRIRLSPPTAAPGNLVKERAKNFCCDDPRSAPGTMRSAVGDLHRVLGGGHGLAAQADALVEVLLLEHVVVEHPHLAGDEADGARRALALAAGVRRLDALGLQELEQLRARAASRRRRVPRRRARPRP